MTNSERLRRKIELLAPGLAAPGRLLLQHPRARELLPLYLTLNYELVVTGIPLMEAASERARTLAVQDAVAAGMADYLERHMLEEMHGDEAGGALLDDLGALGEDTDTLRERPPSPKIAVLIGAQHFLAFHYHPVALLGFLQLEKYHPQRAIVERLIQTTGLPRAGFRQLLLHTEVDVEHAAELDYMLDSLPLSAHHEWVISVSALQMIAHLTDALLDVVEDGTLLNREHEYASEPAKAPARCPFLKRRMGYGTVGSFLLFLLVAIVGYILLVIYFDPSW